MRQDWKTQLSLKSRSRSCNSVQVIDLLKALIDSKAPKADRLEDQVIPQTPKVVPLESSMHPPQEEEEEYEPGTPLPADSDVEPDAPAEPVFPDLVPSPKGEVIPDGFHWDGHRIVTTWVQNVRKGSTPNCGRC